MSAFAFRYEMLPAFTREMSPGAQNQYFPFYLLPQRFNIIL